MVKLRLKIDGDANKLKYISIIRQNNRASIQGIKRNIEENHAVLESNYFDTDELKGFKKTVESLISKGDTFRLFQDEKEIQIDDIRNLIRSYEQIAGDREKLDDRVFGDK